MMKNVIIFGEPRSGKSTLANMIVDKFNYQVIHVDAIRDTFKTIYPELFKDVDIKEKTDEVTEAFLGKAMSDEIFSAPLSFGGYKKKEVKKIDTSRFRY